MADKSLEEQVKEIMGTEKDSRAGRALALLAREIDSLKQGQTILDNRTAGFKTYGGPRHR